MQNEDLRKEWEEYLEQTRRDEQAVLEVCEAFGLNPGEETPARGVVRHIGEALVEAMKTALAAGPRRPPSSSRRSASCWPRPRTI